MNNVLMHYVKIDVLTKNKINNDAKKLIVSFSL